MTDIRFVRRVAIILIIIATVVMLPDGDGAWAQSEWESPYPLILTPERAEAFVQAAEQNLAYLPGEVIVKFRAGTSAAGQDRALQGLRSRPSPSTLQWVGEFAVLRDPTEPDATILADQLRMQPEVEYAEPNYIYHPNVTPNDPSFSSRQWNFTAIDLPTAWDINPGASSNVIVAVLDDGVTTVNATFPFRTWTGTGFQNINVAFAVNPDLGATRLVSPVDLAFWNGPVLAMGGHGAHVASTVGEDTNNNLALAGVAYRALIMPVKVCVSFWEIQFVRSGNGVPGFPPLNAGGCDTVSIAQGIRYAADNNAKVLNLSLGGPGATAILQDALNYAVGRGAFAAIAMGNEFEDGNPVEYPAAYAPTINGVVSVGAVGRSLGRSYYSNTGSHIEIAAPGGDTRDGGIAGMIWQSTLFPPDSDVATVIFPRFDRYAEVPLQGTSMATPHVAGVAALLISQGVNTPALVEGLIKATARDLGTAGRDNSFGYGLIQPRAALFGLGVVK